MATKTELLRRALIARGFEPVSHISTRECSIGPCTAGGDLYIWLDKIRGGRYNQGPKKTESRSLSPNTIKLVLRCANSNLIGFAERTTT